MSRHTASLPPDYFTERYAKDPDPWRFATSEYEAGKYAATLAALPRERYAAFLEIGCSIGVLTRALAPRCDHLLGLDVAEAALDQARARCADLPQVAFGRMQVPDAWPAGTFDAILLSEVVYYLAAPDVARLAVRVGGSVRPGSDILLVHWTGETDYPLSGDEAADLFIRDASGYARVVRQDRAEKYRLDVLTAT